MKQRYLCIKDWEIESGVYYKQGEYYNGIPYNNGNSVKMYGEVGMVINFHKGSEHFAF